MQLLQNALGITDKTQENNKIQKLSISVALLALEAQIKIKNIYCMHNRNSINQKKLEKYMLSSTNQINVEQTIKKLL
jgi:hypothetical protein